MKKTTLSLLFALSSTGLWAQSQLYPEHFELSEVTLADGALKTAQDRNYTTLLFYDVDRLLTPFVRQAGLNTGDYATWTTDHPNFDNWGSGNFRLDGHVGGHYLTALALAYASCHDETTKASLKTKMDHMVEVMNACQSAFDNDETGLYGFIGGYPDNSIWTSLYSGNISAYTSAGGNVPLYVQHKIFAGLRDAYVYGKNETAKTCFFKMADWFVGIFKNVSETDRQTVLDIEHGGVNEVLADAYKLALSDATYSSKASDYLTAAKWYSHTTMVTGMQTVATPFPTTSTPTRRCLSISVSSVLRRWTPTPPPTTRQQRTSGRTWPRTAPSASAVTPSTSSSSLPAVRRHISTRRTVRSRATPTTC